MDLSTILTIVGFAIGLPCALAGLYGVLAAVRNRGRIDQLTETVEVLATTNGELRDTVQFERGERQRQEQQCKVEVAELRGVVDTLQGETVTRLLESIADSMAKAQANAIRNLAETVGKAVTDAIHQALNNPERRAQRDTPAIGG